MAVQPDIPIRFSSRAKFVTVAVVALLAILLLSSVTHILMPFIWAIIIAYIFNPVVGLLHRRTNLPRFWWVLLLYALGFGLLFLFGSYVIPLVIKQYNEISASLPAWRSESETYVRE